MTLEEALNLKTFDHYCTCGGFAHTLNNRNPKRPHTNNCPQAKQYNEWYDIIEQYKNEYPSE